MTEFQSFPKMGRLMREIVYHTASDVAFKRTIKNDEAPKTKVKE